jgi:hypothetical protein
VSLGPFHLSGLAFHFEVLLALASTEAKTPSVISDECDSFGRIYAVLSLVKIAKVDVLAVLNVRTRTKTAHFHPASICQQNLFSISDIID